MIIHEERQEHEDKIDQPLYSRMMIGLSNDAVFFNNHFGQFNKLGERVEREDTNINMPGQIDVVFTITGIRFRETIFDMNVREHLLKYGHFILRVVDRDYLVYPLHLMDNYYYFLERKLTVPIVIMPSHNFLVMLRMRPYKHEFHLTCELLGIMTRRNL